MRSLLSAAVLITVPISALMTSTIARADWDNLLVAPHSQAAYAPQDIAAIQNPGKVIIMGESHDAKPDHANQIVFLKKLAELSNSKSISVGMEFFEYPQQGIVEKFVRGGMSDAEFLKAIAWGKNDFSQYRTQVKFPAAHSGNTYALNLPKKIASHIAMNGLKSLKPDEAAMLPPGFELGRDSYRARFDAELKKVHPEVTKEQLENFFAAHSAWDDTMAWQINDIMTKSPNQILVVIVGRFHVDFGGGLPDRLRARGYNDILTLTQYAASSGTTEDLNKAITMDPTYGEISNYVWIQGEPQEAKH